MYAAAARMPRIACVRHASRTLSAPPALTSAIFLTSRVAQQGERKAETLDQQVGDGSEGGEPHWVQGQVGMER